MKTKITERDLLRTIMDYLDIQEARGMLWYFRAGAGQVKLQNGGFMRLAKAGTPDIIVCLKGGLWLGLEAKVGKNIQNDSQKAVQRQIEALGGRYEVVRSLDDVMNLKY